MRSCGLAVLESLLLRHMADAEGKACGLRTGLGYTEPGTLSTEPFRKFSGRDEIVDTQLVFCKSSTGELS